MVSATDSRSWRESGRFYRSACHSRGRTGSTSLCTSLHTLAQFVALAPSGEVSSATAVALVAAAIGELITRYWQQAWQQCDGTELNGTERNCTAAEAQELSALWDYI